MGWRRKRIAKSATKWLEPGEAPKLVLTGNVDKGGEFAIIATDRNVYEFKLPRLTKVEKPRRKTPLAAAKVGIESEGALPELGRSAGSASSPLIAMPAPGGPATGTKLSTIVTIEASSTCTLMASRLLTRRRSIRARG